MTAITVVTVVHAEPRQVRRDATVAILQMGHLPPPKKTQSIRQGGGGEFDINVTNPCNTTDTQ